VSGRRYLRGSLVVGLALCTVLLSGCGWLHRWTYRESRNRGCHEQPFEGNADTHAPLQVPSGLSAPDTTGAIKVPQLAQPNQPRSRDAPCLDMPPSYGSEPTGLPPPRRPQT
jgi:uncharacterized lipoprotein